ncbi:AMP-binding protein, partial [Streptomyces sp. NPDC048279]|uniref:AMP-binding protein n=1 Tax=Streptomyces sp. NPDC048279 TaxID=3154714 RepID=UPI00341D5FF1
MQQLFERRAALRPDAPAVIAPDRTLSYGQLADASRQVARRLTAGGARPGQLVAIVMEKNWEQIVAASGMLFSGAAYLPVDPDLPGRRLRQLLDQSLPAVAGTPLPPPGSPDDVVHTMLTSGSTGEPKGVMVPHRAQANCPVRTIETYRVTGADRGPAVAALHPYLSAFDLFGLLAARGSVA